MRPDTSSGSPNHAAAILTILERNPDGLTRNEIATLTRIRLSTVCGRVGDLLEAGLLMRGPARQDSVTDYENETLLLGRPRGLSAAGKPTRQIQLASFEPEPHGSPTP